MVVITGSAGFIGSQFAEHHSTKDLLLVDKLDLFEKRRYLPEIYKRSQIIDADFFIDDIKNLKKPELIIHMGAITNTAERDWDALLKWNVHYTQKLWNYAAQNQVPFIYASSAATYGSGTLGFSDDHAKILALDPLNLYGRSKHEFDIWALKQKNQPPFWYGLKFFNVYGPYENHKGRMASSVFHGYNEIKTKGAMTLFRSHNPQYKDGEQARDFIFVKDILKISDFLLKKKPASGIYNCGTGHAGTFKTLAESLFGATGKPLQINWVATPVDFRAGYQYKTQAETNKLRQAGFTDAFTTLSEGIKAYCDYLKRAPDPIV